MKKFMDMSPYELGECGREEAIKYLIMYLTKGRHNDKRLAASAIGKLSDKYRESADKTIPFLIENLNDSHGQVRQYTLKALTKLRVPDKYKSLIHNIYANDTAEYNRRAAKELLEAMESLKNSIEGNTANSSASISNQAAEALKPSVLVNDSKLQDIKDTPDEAKNYDLQSFNLEDAEDNYKEKIGISEEAFIKLLNDKCKIALTEKQKSAVLHVNGPALVLAVPGAGKTTVLLSRTANLIINHGVNPASILSITFSRASASDMKNRYSSIFKGITSIEANFSTIHSFAFELIRKYSIMKGIKYKIIEDTASKVDKRSIIRSIFKEVNGHVIDDDALEDLINYIGYAKNMMFGGDELNKYAMSIEISKFVQIFEKYDSIKKEKGYIDYDDMLTLAYNILLENEEILNRYRELYQYIQIDEGQDTSKIQHKLIELIARPKNNVFIVADDDQSIYSFRGAYPKFLIEFDKIYASTKKYYIEDNFRSTPQIIQLANRFIKNNVERFNKELKTSNMDGAAVRMVKLRDEREQIEYILKEVEKSKGSSSAILYRNNMISIGLGDELNRRGADFYLRDYQRFFFKHFVVTDIKAFILFAMNSADRESFNRIYYRINSFIAKETVEKINSFSNKEKDIFKAVELLKELPENQANAFNRLKRCFDMLRMKAPKDFICFIEKDMTYDRYLRENAVNYGYNYDSLRVILTNLKALSSRCSTLMDFLKRLDELELLMEDARKVRKKDSIILSTIHSSKGLEFDNVFIVDLIENIIPTRNSIEKFDNGSRIELEEERRLMYVALTRAKKNLHLISIQNKNDEPAKSSRFIREILLT